MLFALSCAIWTAFAVNSIRMVGGRTHPLMLGLSWSLANTFLSPLFMGGNHHESVEYGWFEIKHLAFICFANILCQVFMTLAYLKEKAARVAPIGAFQLIINCGVDIFILNSDKPVQYNQVIGALIIFCSNITISMLKC